MSRRLTPEIDAQLPCGRSAPPGIDHFHFLEGGEQLGAVLNNLTGAWLGGDKAELRKIFDHILSGQPSLDSISRASRSELERSNVLSTEYSSPSFHPHLAVLHVGHACNIDCTYCYAPKNSEAMSPNVMEQVTDFIAKLPHHVFVQFMGGEPLVYRDQIAQLVALLDSKRQGLETTYGLQTNGLLLLDDGVLDFLDKRKIRFGISYDGPGTMSEARFGHRLLKLQDKMEHVVSALGSLGYSFGVLAVMNRSNHRRMNELINWCLERGISKLLINPLLETRYKSTPHTLSSDDAAASMQSCFRYWVDNQLYNKIDIENFQSLEHNISTLTRPYMCRKQSCGAGREQLAFDTDGNIFPCDYLVGERLFELGNAGEIQPSHIEFGVRMNELHSSVKPSNLRDCRSCPVFSFCGNCMASSYFRDGTLNGRRQSCNTDFGTIQGIIFELLCNHHYRKYVLGR